MRLREFIFSDTDVIAFSKSESPALVIKKALYTIIAKNVRSPIKPDDVTVEIVERAVKLTLTAAILDNFAEGGADDTVSVDDSFLKGNLSQQQFPLESVMMQMENQQRGRPWLMDIIEKELGTEVPASMPTSDNPSIVFESDEENAPQVLFKAANNFLARGR